MSDTQLTLNATSGRSARGRLRADARGRFALWAIGTAIIVALLAPLLASDRPLVCRYQGRLHFPAVADFTRGIPLVSRALPPPGPLDRPTASPKRLLEPEDFAIWPLIPYGQREISADILSPPSRAHWLGTDEVGRDVASRMIHGGAVSVRVAVLSVALAALIGVIVGALAGYAGGATDMLISRLIEIVACFPVFFLILAVMVWVRPSITSVIIVLGLTRWTAIARYTRAEFLKLKHQDFIAAARALGLTPWRIMARHLAPNALAPVWVAAAFGMGSVVLLEAGLSWLGFGVQAPDPSWGSILRSGYDHLRSAPHLIWPPCAAIFLAVLSCNMLGDALRDALDPTTDRAAR